MGQLHQTFVIACINGRYRGLAAIHQQWLMNQGVTQKCERLIAIFESPSNRLALSSELNFAKTLPHSFWGDDESDSETDDEFQEIESSADPFPYIQTCLTACALWNPATQSYSKDIYVESFNMECDEMANDEGITVLDITDLQRVRHAFVKFEDADDESVEMRPLTSGQYLYGRNDRTSILDHELLDVEALESAWPRRCWQEALPLDDGDNNHDNNNGNDGDDGSSSLGNVDLTTKKSTTLKRTSMDRLFEELLSSSSNEFDLAFQTAGVLSDFWPTVKEKLYSCPSILAPHTGRPSPGAIRLFAGTLENETILDLCPFQLTEEEVEYILLSGPSKLSKLRVLNLSGNKHLTDKLLQKILVRYPDLSTLYLLNTPQISLQTKLGLLRGSKITDFLDTALLVLPFTGVPNPELDSDSDEEEGCEGGESDEENQVGEEEGDEKLGEGREDNEGADETDKKGQNKDLNAQGDEADEQEYEQCDEGQQNPLSYLPLPVSQVIVIGLDSRYDLSENPRTSDGGLNVDKLLHCSRNFGVSLHLNGTNMPSSAFFSSITEFLHYVGSSEAMEFVQSNDYLNIRKPLGCCLTRELSADDPHKIRPIPPELYSGGPALPKQLTPGEWTLMIVLEVPDRWGGNRRSPALRYAFLSMESKSIGGASRMEKGGTSEKRVIKEDIEGFLSRSVIDPRLKQQILSRWKDRLGTLRIYQDFYRRDESTSIEYPIGVCGMEEVESCLRYQDERLELAERERIQRRKMEKRSRKKNKWLIDALKDPELRKVFRDICSGTIAS